MRPGLPLRPDYDAAQLWALAKATRDAGQSRRLLALAEIYDGGSRTKAARIGGVGLQTLRDWVVRFNARGPEGLIDGKAPGNTCKLNESQRQALAEMVLCGTSRLAMFAPCAVVLGLPAQADANHGPMLEHVEFVAPRPWPCA